MLQHGGWQNGTIIRQLNKKGNSYIRQYIFMLYEFICTVFRKTKRHKI